jgi:hypothetical protein
MSRKQHRVAKKKPYEWNGDTAEAAKFILGKSADKQIFVGPLVWQPSDGIQPKVRYFMVCTGDNNREFHCDRVVCEDKGHRVGFIQALISLSSHEAPIILHNMDDELDMAHWCEELWPGEKITRIRRALEEERANG